MFLKHKLVHFAHLLEEDALASENGNYYRTAISKNKSPAAIDFLSSRPELIDWYALSQNPSATLELIRLAPNKEPAHVDWRALSNNPAMIPLLKEKNPAMVQWYDLSSNPAAIEMLLENVDKIVWSQLGRNPAVMDFLKDRYCKEAFLYGPSLSDQDRKNAAIKLGDIDSTRFDMFHIGLNSIMYGGRISDFFKNLSLNEHAVPFLQHHLWCVCWDSIQRNSAAISILMEFPGMIHMNDFSQNTSFEAMNLILKRIESDRTSRIIRVCSGIKLVLCTTRMAGDIVEIFLIPVILPAIFLFIGSIRLLCMFLEPTIWCICLAGCMYFGHWSSTEFFFSGIASSLKKRSDHLYRTVLNWVISWKKTQIVYDDNSASINALLRSKNLLCRIFLSLFSRWLQLPAIVVLIKYIDPGHYHYSVWDIQRNRGAWDILMKYPDLWREDRDYFVFTYHWENILLGGAQSRMLLQQVPTLIFTYSQWCTPCWISSAIIPWLNDYPPDKIWWAAISINPSAMAFLEKNNHITDVKKYVLENPAVFEEFYDYGAIRQRMDMLREDLMKVVFHPKRLEQWLTCADSEPYEWL